MPIPNGKVRLVKPVKDFETGDFLSEEFTRTFKCFLEEDMSYIGNKYANTVQSTETPRIKAEALVYKLRSIDNIKDYYVLFIPKGRSTYKKFRIDTSIPVSYLFKWTTITLSEMTDP